MAINHFVIILAVTFMPRACQGSSKFLSDHKLNEKAFKEDVMNAMDSILGCGGRPDESKIAAVRVVVQPMWLTMPKTNGKIDRRSLRYIAHRYFMQTSSLMLRGFEPSRLTNDSQWGAADVLSQMVPAYVETVLESQSKSKNGFTMQDVVDMILTLDQLIFNAEASLLEDVYDNQKRRRESSLTSRAMQKVLQEYLIRWLIDADPEDYELLLANQSLAREVVPSYLDILSFGAGRIKALDYARQLDTPKGKGKGTFEMTYSFDDAHQIIGGITRSFQSFWQADCESMKASLVDMDPHTTGRVPLSRFYDTALNADWRFGESEQYLRELGALDETSKWIGPQVIITNYLQATSNCIVTTPHYMVCCVNECESLMNEIETAIQAPTAHPATILELIGNMTSQTTLDHDEPPHVNKHLKSQLEQAAKNHGGMVPLHGRLFAQWLHYVFPHECPFPHKMGSVTTATPDQYGEDYMASTEDMERHASIATDAHMNVSKEELQWMSQWSPDEELMVDYQNEHSSTSRVLVLLLMVTAFVLAGAGTLARVFGTDKKSTVTTKSLHSQWV